MAEFAKADKLDRDIRQKYRPPSEAEVNALSPGVPFPIGTRHRFSLDLEGTDDVEWVKASDDAIYSDSLRRKGRRVRALSASIRHQDQQAEVGSLVMSLGRGSQQQGRPSSAPMSRIIMQQKDKGSIALSTAISQSQEVARRPLSALSISPLTQEKRKESKLIDSYKRSLSGRLARPTSAPSENTQPPAVAVASPLPYIEEEVVEDDAGLDGEESYLFSPNQSLHYYGSTRHSKPGLAQKRGSDESSSSSYSLRDRSPPTSRPSSGVLSSRPSTGVLSINNRPPRPQSARPSPLPPRPISALGQSLTRTPIKERPASALSKIPASHKLITISTASIQVEPPRSTTTNHLLLESRQRPRSASSNGLTFRNPAGPSVITTKSHKAYQRQSLSGSNPPHQLQHGINKPTATSPSLTMESVESKRTSATNVKAHEDQDRQKSSTSPGRHKRALEAAQHSFMSLLNI